MTLVERPQTEDRFLTWTDWDGYLHILEAFKDRRIKITYDRGTLELLSPSTLHERIKRFLGQLVDAALFERDIDYQPGGSTTFRRQLLDRGLEPDECYFLSDLSPPGPEDEEVPAPDLAVEVEVSRSALNRMGIYRVLGVPEVWRYTARHRLTVHRLGPAGYREAEDSELLPGLDQELSRFVQLGLSKGSNAMLRAFKAWLAGPDQPTARSRD